jgi:D-aspartate ligase
LTPAVCSRYLRGSVIWPTSGLEDQERLLEGLAMVGRQLPTRAIAIPTDDEAAVLLAENSGELADWFVSPRVPGGLVRMLASKRGMQELCRRHGIPTPEARFPSSVDEVVAFAERALFPVVVKNVEPWIRLRAPAVAHTTVVATAAELIRLASRWPACPEVMIQEYIPRRHAEDWIFHAYCDRDSNCLVSFTGMKLRSWPPYSGVTTYARAMPNPTLDHQAASFCRQIGYCGVVDLGLRLDRRDGRYKLVDFNPRVGAQFRLFENQAGVDVIRALHLDLTGRHVPAGPQVDGRSLIVENLDAPALIAYRRGGGSARPPTPRSGKTELAWMAADDPLPFLAMAGRLAKPAALRLLPGG